MIRIRLGRLLPALAATVLGAAIFAASANAGTVGVTGWIQGSGSMTSVEGGPYSCTLTNGYNDNAASSCTRQAFEAPFESWVWLRPTPGTYPSGDWLFLGWSGCDETRTGTGGVQECAVHSGSFTLDEKAPRATFMDVGSPDISLSGGPPHGTRVSSTSANFTFSSTDTLAAFECKLDSAPTFTPCTSGISYTGLGQGSHTFRVHSKDPSGNTSSDSVRTWTVDTVAPTVSIQSGPSPGSTVNSTSATFVFTTAEPSQFFCQLDGGGLSACSGAGVTGGSRSYTGLTPGSHTFFVYANDGLQSGPTLSRSWTVDVEAPDTTITGGPPEGSSTTDTEEVFTFDSPASDVASYLCSLDDAAYAACSSPHALAGLGQGTHTLRVKAQDAGGNVDATPAERTWTVTAPPTGDGGSDSGGGGTTTTTTTTSTTSGDGSPASFTATPAPVVEPSVLDVTTPLVTFFRANRHRVKRTKALAFTVAGSELSTLVATAKLGRASLGKATKALAAGTPTAVRIKLSRKAQAALRKALTRKRKVSVVVTLALKDAAGNPSTATRKITVVR